MLAKSELSKRIFTVVSVIALAFSMFGFSKNIPPVVETTPTPPSGSISFAGDCKDEANPYFHIVYSLDGNHGVCGPVKVDPPKQVIDGEECPPGTVRQRIYQYEGTEAVCLD